MRQAIRLISKADFAVGWLLVCSSLLISCASEQPKAPERIIQKSSYQKIYIFPYESVWRSAQLSVKYPFAINNMDNGVLETDWIRGNDGFVPPYSKKDPSSGVRYKLTMSLVKGRIDKDSKESVRVTIVKKMEKQRDFFSEPESIESDGMEEKVIFYRMERELLIDEAIKKANSSSQKSNL